MTTMNRWMIVAVAAGVVSLGVVGCTQLSAQAQMPGAVGAPGAAGATTGGLPQPVSFKASAGVPIPAVEDPAFGDVKLLAEGTRFGRRSDPFALLPAERLYESEQANARLTADLGGFSTFFTPEEPAPDEEETTEPQPFRRLSGVLLGDGVIGVIEMEDGRSYEIRPGTRIPNSEWTVLSLNAEQAVLVRSGNTLPRRIIVRLQGRPEGAQTPGNPGSVPGGMPPGGIPGPPGGNQQMGGPGMADF